jgi:hypothetical protein
MIHRIGCCICPFQSERERKFSQQRWPGYWKAYKKSLFLFYENTKIKKGRESFVIHYPTFEEF